MKYNAKFTKIEDGYYRAKINNVELWEVDELLVWTIKEREKEIERLNNIINELEEELERESNMKEEDTCLEHNTFTDIKNTLKTVLKRLQELKGSDNAKKVK